MSNAKLKVTLTGILLIFAIVPALIIGAVGTFSIIGYEKDAKLNTLETVAMSKSAAVDELFMNYVGEVSTLAKLDVVVSAAGNANKDADDLLKAVSNKNADVIDTLIIDAKGTVLSSTTGATGSFEHFSDTMPPVSGMLSWEKYGKNALFVSKEIYADPDTKTGGKLGYVCMVVSLEADSGIAKALMGGFLDNSRVALVDSNGNAVNFNGDGAPTKAGAIDGAFVEAVKNDMFPMTNSVSTAKVHDVTYSDKAGKSVYVCGIIPDITSWRWVGIADSSVFSSFALKANLICWGAVLAGCAVAALIGMLIISKFVGSMHDMLKTMDAIANEENGDEIRFEVKSRKSELGEIQASFNELLDEVQLSEERHRTIAELSDNMLFEWDFHKEMMYVSANALAKFNIDTTQATLSNGRFLDSLMSAEDADKYKRDINTLLKNKNGYSAEYQLVTKSGANIWVSVRAVCITDRLGEPLRVIGVMTDVDNEKKMELQLSERASYDFLSQLYNRNTFVRTLGSEIDRRGVNRVGIMFIDVDDFKFINDRFGHTVGDEVIRFVADTIRKKVDDKGGFAGRFGGDEFVLCMTDQEDIENIEMIAEDLINEMYTGYTTTDGTIINVKASIGIAYCPEHSEDVNELLSFADTAMYFVKKNGKTNFHVYMPEDSESGEYIDPEF